MEKLIQQLKEDTLQSDYAQKKLVFGEGKQNAKICMVGEAPGGDEEKQGRPFVGKAGKNLSSFLEAVGLKREEIYITNVVKFRPTNISPKTGKFVNRPTKKTEIAFFLPYLMKELALVQPEIIVTLGNVPLKAITGQESASIGDMHGEITKTKEGYQLFPLYHPAAIIYNRSLTETYDADLQILKKYLHM